MEDKIEIGYLEIEAHAIKENGSVIVWVDDSFQHLTISQLRQLHTFLTEQLKKIDE